jgi:hypothetical protein
MDQITYTCNGPRVSEDSSERLGCGQDLTAAIEEVLMDGEEHSVECPRCENVVTVRRTPPAPE